MRTFLPLNSNLSALFEGVFERLRDNRPWLLVYSYKIAPLSPANPSKLASFALTNLLFSWLYTVFYSTALFPDLLLSRLPWADLDLEAGLADAARVWVAELKWRCWFCLYTLYGMNLLVVETGLLSWFTETMYSTGWLYLTGVMLPLKNLLDFWRIRRLSCYGPRP